MKKFLQTLMLVAALALTCNTQAQFSYTCNFDNDSDSTGWVLANGTQSNFWTIGTSTFNSGSKSLYITNGTAGDYTYSLSNGSIVYAYREVTIPNDGVFYLTYDWRCQGESNFDYLRVFVVPQTQSLAGGTFPTGTSSSYNLANAEVSGWTSMGTKRNLQSTWQSSYEEVALSAGTYKLVFAWANDASGGTQPPAAVDNIVFAELSCPTPENVTVSNITSGSATISWSFPSNNTPAWMLAYDTLGNSYANIATPTDTSFVLNNLDPNTQYYFYIRAICGAGDSSFIATGSFRTLYTCPVLSAVTVSNVAATSSLISWSYPEGSAEYTPASYTVTLTDTANSAPIVITATSTQTLAGGLTPGMRYSVTVTPNCISTGITTQPVSFVTANLGCAASDPNSSASATIGTGTATATGVPVNSSWGNTYCQSIYTAAELLQAGLTPGNIDSIFLSWSTSSTYNKELTIYLANTTLTSFPSTLSSCWVPASDFTQVYNGSHPTGTSGTVGYALTGGFSWDGSNLVVAILMNQSGGSQSSTGFSGYSTPGPTRSSMYKYQDSNPLVPLTVTSNAASSTSSNRPNITFIGRPCLIQESCAAPNGYVENITPTSVDLVWVAGYQESSWKVEYRPSTDTAWTTALASTASTNETISGLQPNTQYVFRISALCTDTTLSLLLNARTECSDIDALPFTDDFETAVSGTGKRPNCWTCNTTTGSTTYPYVRATTVGNSSKDLYMFASSTYNTYASMQPLSASLDITNVQVKFNAVKTTTTTTYNSNLIVGVCEIPGDMSTFTPVDTIFAIPTTATSYEVNLNNYSGNGSSVTFVSWGNNATNYVAILDVTLREIPSCLTPENLAAHNITTTTAELSWTEMGSAGNWIVEYADSAFTPNQNMGQVEYVSDTTLALSNLDSATTYHVYVMADCGGSYSEYRHITFNTLAAEPAPLPYSCTFEAEGDNGWTFVNGSQYNHWTVGNATSQAGNRSLYITDGTSNNYNVSSISIVYATRTFSVEDTGAYMISFSWKAQGESSFDYLRAFIAPAGTELSAGNAVSGISTSGTPVGWIPLDGDNKLNLQSSWTACNTLVRFNQADNYDLVFFWRNDGSVGNQPPAAIDNISIFQYTCPFPSNLAVTTTAHSADLTWTAGGSETEWEVSDGLNTYTTNTNSYTFTGLDAATTYSFSVRAICSSTDSSAAIYISAATQCAEISLPWSEYFDNYTSSTTAATGIRPNCFNVLMTGSSTYQGSIYQPQVYYNTNYAHSGSYSMRLYGVGYTCLPPVDTTINRVKMSFYSTRTNASYQLEVGVMTDPDVDTTFVSVASISNNATSVPEFHEVDFSQYAGTGRYIAFRNTHTSPTTYYSYHYIDDIDLWLNNGCGRVTNLTTTNVVADTIAIAWADTNANSDWVVEYGPTGFHHGASTSTIVTPSSTSLVIGGLTPSTTYDIYVAAICNGTDTSAWSKTTVTTSCVAIDSLPYSYGFEDCTASSSSAINACWNKGTNYSTAYPYPSSTQHATGNNSLYFYGYYTSGYRSWAVMPLFNHDLDSLQVSFKLLRGNSYTYAYYGYQMKVGVMTDPNDISTFSEISTFQATSATAWDNYTCYLAGRQTNGRYIAFLSEAIDASIYYNYVYLDDVTVDFAPECGPVSNVDVHATPYNALFSWEPGSVGEYAGAIIGIQDTATNTWTYDTVAGTTYMATSLTPGQYYNYSVTNMCEGGSAQAVLGTFATGNPPCLVPDTTAIQTVMFSNGTAQTYGVPVNSSWGNTLCQSIYTAEELNEMGIAGQIRGLDFTWTANSTYAKEFSIYIGTTNQATFSSASNIVPASNMTLVYSGSHSQNTSGTIHYNFNAPFNWDGASNLVVMTFMNQPAGASHTSSGFYGTSTNCNATRTIYRYQDNTQWTLANMTGGSGATSTYRPSLVFTTAGCAQPATCVAPSPVVNATTTSSVSVAWAPGHDETSWNLYYKRASDNAFTFAAASSASNYTFNGLHSGSAYDFKIVANCGSDSAAALISATTDCAKISSLPFFENFNSWGTGSGVIPNCWSRYGSYSTYTYISPTYSLNNPGGSIYVYRSSTASTADCYLTLPELDTNIYHANQLQVVFNVYNATASYTPSFQVGVMTDPNNTSTFVPVDTVTYSLGSGLWENFEVPLTRYADSGAYISIRTCFQGSYFYAYLDDVTLELTPTCPRPDSLTATNPTLNSIDLGWHERGGATEWIVEYGPEGFVPGTGTTVSANSNPFTLTGLPASYQGEYYVRSVCGGNDTGYYSRNACHFYTRQVPATLPYSCDFESATEWNNWQTNSNNYDVNWYRGTAEAGAGNYGLYVSADNGATNGTLSGVYNVAAFRDVDFGTIDSSYTLSFKYKVGGTVANRFDALMVFLVDPDQAVEASNAGITSPWGNVNNLYRVAQCYLDTVWDTYTASFDTISGVHRVAFFWFNQTTDNFIGGPAAIDDLTIDYSACPRPINLEVDLATVNESSAHLSWQGPSNATYEVIYRPVGGTNAFVTVNNATAITLNNLQSSTNYVAWVRKICGADTSLTSDGVAFTTTNQIFQLPLLNDFEGNGTFNFLLENGTNTNAWIVGSAENADSVSGHALYISENGTTATYSTNSASVSYALADVHIDAGILYYSYDWKCQGESSYDFVRVALAPATEEIAASTALPSGLSATSIPATWISLDRNTKLNLQSTWQHVDDSLTIAISGNYHLIYVWRNDGSIGNNPSAAIDNIMLYRTLSGCRAPQVAVSNVTFDGATLTWTGNADSYEVGVVEQNNQNWPASIVVNNAETYTFTSLVPNTTYAYRVRAICADDEASAWTEGTFTTEDLPCFNVSNVRTSNATVSSITVAWDNDPQSTSNAWVINVFNSTTNIMDTVRSNPATVSGLYDNTEYSLAVRSMCAATVFSDWSDTVSFTTSTCQPVTSVAISNITTNGATVTWTAGANETSWEVSYGDMDFTEGNGTNVTVTTTTYTITGLQTGYDYDVYVRAICGNGITSDWSSKKQFTTAAGQGIDGVEGNYSLSIYPNPASGNTTISLRGVEGEVEISVVDMNGRVISTESINCGADCEKSMNVANLAQGTYFVRVLGDGISSVRKLIVR